MGHPGTEADNYWGTTLAAAKWLGAIAAAQFLLLPTAIQTLFALMFAEFFLVLISRKHRLATFVWRCVGSLVIVAVVHLLYRNMSMEFGFKPDLSVGSGVAFFYIVNEVIGIIFICRDLGAPIPPMLIGVLDKAKGLSGIEKQEIEALKIRIPATVEVEPKIIGVEESGKGPKEGKES